MCPVFETQCIYEDNDGVLILIGYDILWDVTGLS